MFKPVLRGWELNWLSKALNPVSPKKRLEESVQHSFRGWVISCLSCENINETSRWNIALLTRLGQLIGHNRQPNNIPSPLFLSLSQLYFIPPTHDACGRLFTDLCIWLKMIRMRICTKRVFFSELEKITQLTSTLSQCNFSVKFGMNLIWIWYSIGNMQSLYTLYSNLIDTSDRLFSVRGVPL